jgi:hypothetical protein
VSPPSSSSSRTGASKGRLVASASTDSDLSIGMDGILGLSDHGPLLGTSAGKKKFGGQPGGKPIKRIVMGDINDILNGQLGDLFGGGESSGASAAGDDDDGDDATENGAILRFGRMSNDDEDDDDEDDDEDDDGAQIEIVNDDEEDDDDDEDDEDEERGSGPQSVSIIKEWARSSSSKRNRNDSGKSSSSSSKVNRVSGAPKDELRQNCIGALRRLCDAGSISPTLSRARRGASSAWWKWRSSCCAAKPGPGATPTWPRRSLPTSAACSRRRCPMPHRRSTRRASNRTPRCQ